MDTIKAPAIFEKNISNSFFTLHQKERAGTQPPTGEENTLAKVLSTPSVRTIARNHSFLSSSPDGEKPVI
jgi:hypothetical protein